VIACSSVSAGVLTLSEEFAVHGGQQLAFSLAEAGVGLDRLDDAYRRRADASGWQISEPLRQRPRLESQRSLERCGHVRPRRRLALFPLPNRALGHADPKGQATLGEARRFAGASQCLAECLSLRLGRHAPPSPPSRWVADLGHEDAASAEGMRAAPPDVLVSLVNLLVILYTACRRSLVRG
jgi:hypothetical protein